MITRDPAVGFVVIGRNEGERLQRCLSSIQVESLPIVYVDSGSTDGSVAFARSLGVDVVLLDLSVPFTAARARNAGYRRLMELHPDVRFVQFVDGDCVVADGWVPSALRFLDGRQDVAAVCGRRREVHPEVSIYNRLCDIEWDTPVGQAAACGGDAMFRTAAFDQVGGFRGSLIAGEEPELCFRLREVGWRIWRLDVEMTAHDAAIHRFSQWWSRSKRAGYAFANGSWLHGRSAERYFVRETARAVVFGVCLPVVAALGAALVSRSYLLLLLYYPLQTLRTAAGSGRLGAHRWVYSLFVTTARFPEGVGALQFFRDSAMRRPGRLIEYK